eukprot:scaffold239661_cov26-Tisochrysis_lutea.AAC.1
MSLMCRATHVGSRCATLMLNHIVPLMLGHIVPLMLCATLLSLHFSRGSAAAPFAGPPVLMSHSQCHSRPCAHASLAVLLHSSRQ